MIKVKIESIVPSYARLPLLGALFANSIAYYGSKIITNNMHYHTLSFKIDNCIPFVSIFIVIYILAYIQWIVGYILIARENKEICYKYVFGDIIAKTICLFIFIIYPTTISRPEITGNGFFESLTRIIYACDDPINLLPSIHCLESWICFRSSFELKKVPNWYLLFSFIFTVLVCLSTVFVKQHFVIDIFAGILVAEIGIYIMKKIQKKEKGAGRLK